MSTIKVNKIENTATADGGIAIDATGHVQIDGVQLPTTGALSNRNLIINGAMNVAQRGTSFTVAHDGSASPFTLDRFRFIHANLDSYDCTVTQDSDSPDGFANSLKVTTGTTDAVSADELLYMQYAFEGQNVQLLNNGAAGAKKVTLSFYVKTSQTGTYSVNLYKAKSTARNITATYTTTTTDWELKVLTFDGDTGGSGIDDDNSEGLRISWNLIAGSDWTATDSTSWGNYATGRWAYGHVQNGMATNASATWQITGVQLEVGEKATPFEHRSHGDELAKCQRYYQDGTYFQTDGNGPMTVHLIREMRAAPVMAVTASTAITASAAGTAHYTGVSTGNTATEFTIYNPGGSSVIGCTYTATSEL